MAWGEHDPWPSGAAWRAGIAADRRSGYLAIASSIWARSSGGTGVVAGSGTSAGGLPKSTDSSHPGTRLPWPNRGTGTGGLTDQSLPNSGRGLGAVQSDLADILPGP